MPSPLTPHLQALSDALIDRARYVCSLSTIRTLTNSAYWEITAQHVQQLQTLLALPNPVIDDTSITLLTHLMDKLNHQYMHLDHHILCRTALYINHFEALTHNNAFLAGCLTLWHRLDAPTQQATWQHWTTQYTTLFHPTRILGMLALYTEEPFYATLLSHGIIGEGVRTLLLNLIKMKQNPDTLTTIAKWHETHLETSPISEILSQIPEDHRMRDNARQWVHILLDLPAPAPFIPSEYLIDYLKLPNDFLETWSDYRINTLWQQQVIPFCEARYTLTPQRLYEAYLQLAGLPCITEGNRASRYCAAIHPFISYLGDYWMNVSHDPIVFYLIQQIAYQTRLWTRADKKPRVFPLLLRYCSEAIPTPPVPPEVTDLHHTSLSRYLILSRIFPNRTDQLNALLNLLNVVAPLYIPDATGRAPQLLQEAFFVENHLSAVVDYMRHHQILPSMPLLRVCQYLLISDLRRTYVPPPEDTEWPILKETLPLWTPTPTKWRPISSAQGSLVRDSLSAWWTHYQALLHTPACLRLLQEQRMPSPTGSIRFTLFACEDTAEPGIALMELNHHAETESTPSSSPL